MMADVGAGRYQGVAAGATQGGSQGVSCHAHRQTLMSTTEPERRGGLYWQQPGNRTWPTGQYALQYVWLGGLYKWQELREVGRDQDQALVDVASFEFKQTKHGSGIQWITAETIDGFGGVGDDPALADGLRRPSQLPTTKRRRVV